MNEKMLAALFDYQKFESNEALQRLIKEAEQRYPGKVNPSGGREELHAAGFKVLSGMKRELSDTDMGLVNAAGEIDIAPSRKDIDKNEDNI